MTQDWATARLSAVPAPMLWLDATGRIGAANKKAGEVFGDWLIGQPYALLRNPQLLGLIETAYRHGAGGEARFVATGRAAPEVFRVNIQPVSWDGAEQGLMLHFEDLTHLREAEEQRRDFVANVSHELRTPLTAIMGFIETLRGPARGDNAAADRFLGIMEEEARRMNRIVSDLLSLGRVEANERIRPDSEVVLREVLETVVAALRPQAAEAGNTLALDVEAASDPRVLGDQDQLIQVVMNLTENALKYGGPDKPVTLRLSQAERGLGVRGPVARLDVIDRGEGSDAAHIPRLTERFYRVDAHRSRAMGGTGLGLAIVKHIVNRHRGQLEISSAPGQGSTFTVWLPRLG